MVRKKSKKRISLKQLKRDYKLLTSRSLKFGLFEGIIQHGRKIYRNNKTAVHLTAGALAVTGTVATMHYRNKNQIKKREQEIQDSKKQMEAMKIDYASGRAKTEEEIKRLKEITSIESAKLKAAEAREQALQEKLKLEEQRIKIEDQRIEAQRDGNLSQVNNLTAKLNTIEKSLLDANLFLQKKQQELDLKEQEIKLLQDSLHSSNRMNKELVEKKNRESNHKYKEEHCRNKQEKIDRIMEILKERKVDKTVEEAYSWFIKRLETRSPVSIEMYNGTLDTCIKDLEEYNTDCGSFEDEMNVFIKDLKRFKKEFNIYYQKKSTQLQQTVDRKKYTRTLDDPVFRDYDENTRENDRRRIPTSNRGSQEAFFFGKKRKN